MTREEAIDIIRDTYHTETELEALKVLLPELQESEDEEMIEGIIGDLCALKDWIIKYDTNWLANPVLKNIDKRIAWLKSLKDRGNFPKSNTNSPSEWSPKNE